MCTTVHPALYVTTVYLRNVCSPRVIGHIFFFTEWSSVLQTSNTDEDDYTFLLVVNQQHLQIKSIFCLIDYLGPFQDLMNG